MINPNNCADVLEVMEDILEADIPFKSVESLTERQREWFVKIYDKYIFGGVGIDEVKNVINKLLYE